MTFRLATLFYLIALTASAAAAFGLWGLLAAAAVPLVAWACGWLRYAGGEEIAALGALLLVPLAIVMFLIARSNWEVEFPVDMLQRKHFVLYVCLFSGLALMPTNPAIWRRIGPRPLTVSEGANAQGDEQPRESERE